MTDSHVLPVPPRAGEAEMSTPLEPAATGTGQATNAQKAVASLKVGMKISERYLLLSRLAIGGMGEVWQTLDEKTGERLALKILRPELAGKKLFLSRLQIEAYNASRVHHPNLAEVHASGEDAGLGWISMELVDGVSLTEILDQEHILETDFLLSVLYQTADALSAVHGAGIVHRDIKPGNIMVTPTGEVKLTDFGISKAPGQVNLTQAGMVMGTAQYLPPEQAMGQPATPAGDLYALGVIAYEALAGKRPFSGDKPVDIAFAHVNKPVPALPDSVAPSLRELVMELLEKEPQKRLASADALMQRLEEVQQALNSAGDSLPAPAAEASVPEAGELAANLAEPAESAEVADKAADQIAAEPADLENLQEDLEEIAQLDQAVHTPLPASTSGKESLTSQQRPPSPDIDEPAAAAATAKDATWQPRPAASAPREEDGSPMLYLSGGTVPAPQILPDSVPLPEKSWQQRVRLRERPREFAALIPPVSASRPRSQLERLRSLPQALNWRKTSAPPRYAKLPSPAAPAPAPSLTAPLAAWSRRLESQIGIRPVDPLAAQVARLRRPYEKAPFLSRKWWNQDVSRARHGNATPRSPLYLVLVTLILWMLVTALSLGASLVYSAAPAPVIPKQKAVILVVSEQKEDPWQNLHTA
ncbi:serine/threonine-protein kinase [Varibaculum cambriense]|uniref:serine/threonine-protein kinase n=1 Tax=Varibaculum cambriense TaxID=184870 RepID=UPI00241F470E|nr:serine/threonine-protein kinase [Varibaculum cambriense]